MAICCIIPCWLLIIYGFRAHSIGAGAEWLRWYSRTRDRWVRTDDLVKVSYEPRWLTPYLVLKDRDGRYLRVDLDELRASPPLYRLVIEGVKRSQAKGLRLNLGTARELGLPRGFKHEA